MVLEFKFKYLSSNNTFVNILDNILSKKGSSYKINRIGDFIFLYVEDEEDRLLKISDEISNELPMSFFLQDFTLEVVPQIPNFDYQYTPDSLRKSYCSNCLTKIEEDSPDFFYNPFVNCEICGTTCDVNSFKIEENGVDFKFDSYKQLFEKLANKIDNNEKVEINGKIFSKFQKLEKENQTLLCTNADKLSSLVVGSKQKSVILLSLEKPIISFNVNSIYQTNNNCKIKKVDIRASWNIFIYLLSKELSALGINFLNIEKNINTNLKISFEDNFKDTKISITNNKIFLLENSDYSKELDKIYDSAEDDSKGQFLVLINENNLFEKSILNFYISSKNSDAISLYSPKIDGIVDVMKFNLPENMEEIFSKISESESGKRLFENYKEKFPQNFLDALAFDFSTLKESSYVSLLKIASLVLGIDDIYEKANEALLQRGPRVDHKLKDSDKVFNKEFELEKFIKSGMSFKLAGVDEKTLSLGYIESFIYFLSDTIDLVNEQFPLDGVSFSGDFIANEFLMKMLDKAINKNHKLYYNKDFPIQL